MKITIKTLSNAAFDLTVEPAFTVGQVKALIEKEQSHEAVRQKLIYAGKVLKDDQVLEAVGVKESDFLVLMIGKKPAGSAPAPAPAAAAAPAPAPAAAAPAPAAAPAAAAPAPAAAADAAPAAAADSVPSAAAPSAVGVTDEAVAELAAMGFPDDQVRAALAAAFGSRERAVEYLMSGIPEGAGAVAPPPVPAAPTGAADAAPAAPAAPAAAADPSDPLAMLRSHPQINQLRSLVQRNPAQLPQVLQQIGSASPALLELITAHREEFIALMNEPIEEGAADAAPPAAGGAPGMPGLPGGMDPRMLAQMIQSMTPEQRASMATSMGIPAEALTQVAELMASGAMPPGMGGMGGGAAPPPGATVVRLTEAENAAVERLIGMGFGRDQVIEAFLACDKNEQLAANYLLNSMDM